ncbi:MAG: hypothetical protein ABSA31_06675 [Acidimicrobiales bacterium]|jgi:hypothetical protein
MAVREDCRHYVMQTVRGSERTEVCKLGVNDQFPFACPDGCVFFEKRTTSSAGWSVSREGRETPPNP